MDRAHATWLRRTAAAVLIAGTAAAALVSLSPLPAPAGVEPADHLVLNRLNLLDLEPVPESQPSDRILLVTLDTLRADHLSCYGYVRRTSPFLDSLAAEGARFDRAFVSMATTAPSHTTMMTGLYPLQHKVLKNGLRLSDDVGTLAEILAADGYETAAFVGTNVHFVAGNIDQGFATFNEPTAQETNLDAGGTDEALELEYRPAERTLAHARRWLERTPPPAKIFLWIHLFDAHMPYVTRREHLEPRRNDGETEAWLDFIRDEHGIDCRSGPGVGPGTPRVVRDPDPRLGYELYDAEIRHLDAQLAAFVDDAAAMGFDFLTIVIGDHGEGLGAHGWWGHGKHIYNEQARVPLIMRWPDGRHAGAVVDTIVEETDLMPTILAAAGADAGTVAANRRRPIEGTPLQRVLSGDDRGFGHALIQRRQYSEAKSGSDNYEAGDQFALVTEHWKYIYRTAGPDELYDLAGDFHERHDLIDAPTAPRDDLQATLLDLVTAIESGSQLDPELVDEQTIRALRALGYVQ